MQATKNWNRKSKKYFASAIIRSQKQIVKDKIKDRVFNYAKRIDEGISDKIKEYSRQKSYFKRNLNPTAEKRVLGRIRSEALRQIIRGSSATKLQLAFLGLTGYDVLFEGGVLNQLALWIEDKYTESDPIRQGLRAVAVGGQTIDYSELERLKEALKEARIEEENLIDIQDGPQEQRNRGETYTADEIIQTALEIATDRRIELENKVQAEGWRCSEEKSRPDNLCHFLLYDTVEVFRQEVIDYAEIEGYIPDVCNPDDFCKKKVEDKNRVLYRIQHLSKHNLKILVGIICKILNEPIAGDLMTDVKLQTKIGRRKKEFTASEKKAKIIKLQADNFSQSQVVKMTGFSLKTVKRAWI